MIQREKMEDLKTFKTQQRKEEVRGSDMTSTEMSCH